MVLGEVASGPHVQQPGRAVTWARLDSRAPQRGNVCGPGGRPARRAVAAAGERAPGGACV